MRVMDWEIQKKKKKKKRSEPFMGQTTQDSTLGYILGPPPKQKSLKMGLGTERSLTWSRGKS